MAYRHYVLILLLFVYIHCLLCRMLPAFLVSVPVPGCDQVCAGVDSQPLCDHTGSWRDVGAPAGNGFSVCQDCRAGIGIPQARGASGNFFNMRDGACIGKWQYGLLMGYGFALPFVFGSFFTMQVVDHVDRRFLLSVALASWSAATVMMSFAESFWLLLLCRCVLGVVEASVVPAALSLLTQYFDEGSRASAASLLSAGVCLGAGGASFGVPLALQVGWRNSCVMFGGVGLVLALLVYTTISEPTRIVVKRPSVDGSFIRTPPVVWILTAATALRLAASYTIASFLPVYYLRAQLPGYSAASYAAGNAVIVATAGLASALCGGAAADYFSARYASAPMKIAAVAQVLAAVFFVGVFQASTFAGSLASYAAALLFGECWYGLTLIQVQSVVEASVQGQTTTMMLSIATLVSNSSPAIVGAADPGTRELGVLMLQLIAGCVLLTAILFAMAARKVEAQAEHEGRLSLLSEVFEDERDERGRAVRFAKTSAEVCEDLSSVNTSGDESQLPPNVVRLRSRRDSFSEAFESVSAAVFRQASQHMNHFAAPGQADIHLVLMQTNTSRFSSVTNRESWIERD